MWGVSCACPAGGRTAEGVGIDGSLPPMPMTTELDQTLASMVPALEGTYAFTVVPEVPEGIDAFAIVREKQGWTIVLDVAQAQERGLACEEIYAKVSLGLVSGLAAVGVTASIAQVLSSRSITANFIVSNHENHLFVQEDRAGEALALLEELARAARGWLPQS